MTPRSPKDEPPPSEATAEEELALDRPPKPERAFDAELLREPIEGFPHRDPLIFSEAQTVYEAMQAMQEAPRGAVLITRDGTAGSPLVGIVTDRDVLHRVVGKGRNPATLPVREIMTRDPESLPVEASIAWVLNRMALGGFRHVPIVDDDGCPRYIVSVRDVVQFLVEFFPREVLNLPPEYDSKPSRREGA